MDFNDIDISKMNLNFNNAGNQLANQIAEMERKGQESIRMIAKHNAKKDKALFETADASIAQKELLEEQLIAVKEQNKLLQMNYDTLNELYNNTKTEAIENKTEAKRSRVFGWITFTIGTLIGAAGLVAAIITLAVSI